MDNVTYFDDDGGVAAVGSTVYYSDVTEQEPQQSFIFGAGDFETSNNRPLSNAAAPDANVPSMIAPAITETSWGLVFRHWILSAFFLPLFVLALVTRTWRVSPQSLSKRLGVTVILSSCLVYALLWSLFGVYMRSASVRAAFSMQQLGFLYFLYFMCCFAESMLKNTRIRYSTTDEPTSEKLARERNATSDHAIALHAPGASTTVGAYLETILTLATPSKSKQRTAQALSALMAALYATSVLALHMYQLRLHTVDSDVIIYLVFVTVVHGAVCLAFVYPLSQVALRLSVRSKVAKLFQESVSYSEAQHAFRLVSLTNIRAWQTIRDTLTKRYAFPTLYVDVVVSAAFTLWVPLVFVAVLDFLFRSSITPLAFNATVLAVLILAYLLACVLLAADVQDTLSSTVSLRWQEYHFLVCDKGDAGPLTDILGRLAVLVEQGRESAIVFQVWGFPLNHKMATFLGGVLLTLSSSVLVRAASAVGSM